MPAVTIKVLPLVALLSTVVTVLDVTDATTESDNIFLFSTSLKDRVSPETMNKFRDAMAIKDGYDFDDSNYVEVVEEISADDGEAAGSDRAPGTEGEVNHEMDKIVKLGNLEFNVKDSALTQMGSVFSRDSVCVLGGVPKPCPMLSRTRYETTAFDSVTNQMYDIRVDKDVGDKTVIDSIRVKEFGGSNNFAATEGLTYNLRHVVDGIYVNVPNDAIDYDRFTETYDGDNDITDATPPATRRQLLRRQGEFQNVMNNFDAKINTEKVKKVQYDDAARNPHHRRRLPAEECTECYELRVGIVSETTYCERFGNDDIDDTLDHLEAYVAEISTFYEVAPICTDLVLSFVEVVSSSSCFGDASVAMGYCLSICGNNDGSS